MKERGRGSVLVYYQRILRAIDQGNGDKCRRNMQQLYTLDGRMPGFDHHVLALTHRHQAAVGSKQPPEGLRRAAHPHKDLYQLLCCKIPTYMYKHDGGLSQPWLCCLNMF